MEENPERCLYALERMKMKVSFIKKNRTSLQMKKSRWNNENVIRRGDFEYVGLVDHCKGSVETR